MKEWIKVGVCGVALSLGAFACGGGGEEGDGTTKGGVDVSSFGQDDGKSDLAKSTKLLDNVSPDATIQGRFDPRLRTYGYVIEARKGAKITINLEATAGKDAAGIEEGAELDMIYEVYGLYQSPKKPGEKLISADDTSETDLSAPSQVLEIEEDGRYFLAFTSYNDTGKGEYRLDLTCEGTDVQCMRPDFDKPCEDGRQYIQGAEIADNQTWGKCEVVILENATIMPDAQVTINPGVEVKGNYIGSGQFGTVRLNVEGLLQAVGTSEAPIVFTNFVENQGWGGLTFSSKGSRIEHAYIENAQVGVRVATDAQVTIDHAVIEGMAETRDNGDTFGLDVLANGEANLTHTTVKNFFEGIRVNQSELVTLDQSVVRENVNGIHVIGSGQARTSCTQNIRVTAAPRPFDPKINNSDIIHNTGTGLFMERDNVFIQIEKSNIAHNAGLGIVFRGRQLAGGSYIRESNILFNNSANEENSSVQVQSFHDQGTFDLSGNYWHYISDPALSTTRNGCNGNAIIFTGFAPEPIKGAGPILDDLTEPVKKDTFQAEQN
jgi:hypothetical protein